ncbi:MAG TPA: response regulator [Candidatus Binatia bacterium]|jgi:two-component system response regulator|nr:response regulator [Candidatus Binatia bacterium]
MGTTITRAILLVEDNPADIYLIHKVLEECGFDLHLSVVTNGRDALAFLRHEAPYALEPEPVLILLDLNLPKLPGAEVLTELRHLPGYQATPIVVFSGADSAVEEPRCLQLGASAYRQKPSNFYAYVDTLRAIVRQWLRPADAPDCGR